MFALTFQIARKLDQKLESAVENATVTHIPSLLPDTPNDTITFVRLPKSFLLPQLYYLALHIHAHAQNGDVARPKQDFPAELLPFSGKEDSLQSERRLTAVVLRLFYFLKAWKDDRRFPRYVWMMYEWDRLEWWRPEFAAGSAGDNCSDDEIEQMVEWSLIISHYYQSAEKETEFDDKMMAIPFDSAVNVRHEIYTCI